VAAGRHHEELGGTQGELAALWTRVLGVPAGADTDFFDAGGGSLAAAQLVSLARKDYPDLSVADIYAHPVLTDQAARLDELGGRQVVTRTVRPVPRATGLAQHLDSRRAADGSRPTLADPAGVFDNLTAWCRH